MLLREAYKALAAHYKQVEPRVPWVDHLHQKKTHGIFLRPKNRILGEILNLQKSSDFEDHFEYYFEAVELTNQPTVKPEIFQISQTPKNKTVPLVFFFRGMGSTESTICRSRTWRRTKFEHWEVCLSHAQLEQWRGCRKHPLGDSCAARIFVFFHMH